MCQHNHTTPTLAAKPIKIPQSGKPRPCIDIPCGPDWYVKHG